jgi:NADH pyrophosphatase NudC (nudix superfamily)
VNPFIAAAMHLLDKKATERRCGACGNRQKVAAKQAGVAVPCGKCGKPIPPAKT